MQSKLKEKYEFLQEKCPLRGKKVSIAPQDSTSTYNIYSSPQLEYTNSSRSNNFRGVNQSMRFVF